LRLSVQIHIGMTNVKLIASQAHLVNQYKNIRSKLQRYCANIYFNKQRITKKINPKYVNTKIANTLPASQTTAKKAQLIRIKDGIKFVYKEKEKTKPKWCVRLN